MNFADVDAVFLHSLHLPMASTHSWSAHSMNHRQLIMVEMHTSNGVGWGECAALNQPSDYSSEFIDGEFQFMQQALESGAGVDEPIWDHHQASRSAMTMAWLDAQLKAKGVPLAEHLGMQRSSVPAVAVVSSRNWAEVADECELLVATGYGHIKVKLWDIADLDGVSRLVERWPQISWRGDANGGWSRDALAVRRLDESGLSMIEQPFGRDCLADHFALANRTKVTVAVDESVHTVAKATQLAAMGSQLVVAVKPAVLGGLQRAGAVAGMGNRSFVGGMIDGPLGRNANLALASSLSSDLASEIAIDGRWFDASPGPELTSLTAGCAAVPTEPGVGTIRLDVLQQFSRQRVEVRPPKH